jgi:hypothetical protein
MHFVVTHQISRSKTFFVTHQKKVERGRPKLPEGEARSVFVSTRLSPEEHQEIVTAIRKSGKKKSDWLRGALLGKARSHVAS